MNDRARRALRWCELGGAVLACAAVFIGLWHHSALGVAGATVGMYLLLLAVNRIPIRKMNLMVEVTDENASRIESAVRPRLGVLALATTALFTWITATAAFGALELYLATFWIFLLAIAGAMVSMIRAVRKAA